MIWDRRQTGMRALDNGDIEILTEPKKWEMVHRSNQIHHSHLFMRKKCSWPGIGLTFFSHVLGLGRALLFPILHENMTGQCHSQFENPHCNNHTYLLCPAFSDLFSYTLCMYWSTYTASRKKSLECVFQNDNFLWSASCHILWPGGVLETSVCLER